MYKMKKVNNDYITGDSIFYINRIDPFSYKPAIFYNYSVDNICLTSYGVILYEALESLDAFVKDPLKQLEHYRKKFNYLENKFPCGVDMTYNVTVLNTGPTTDSVFIDSVLTFKNLKNLETVKLICTSITDMSRHEFTYSKFINFFFK